MLVILTPGEVETMRRPEYYGTPHYFGKVEWFDVLNRETDEMLDWTVSRVDGKEVTVNHPRYGVVTGLADLRAALEVCDAQYRSERNA